MTEINILLNIKNKYGDKKVSEILKDISKQYPYKCPQCNGEGITREKYNDYPSNLPDSGWIEDIKYKETECSLCNGIGYTKEKYAAQYNTVFSGYSKI